jgi:uncharacterized linocin/CFP29 family protein
MDMLKRELAPLAEAAWKEIDERASEVLKSHLTARKIVSVKGPYGWDYTVIPEGRLRLLEFNMEDDVKTGQYQVKPLVETRVLFSLNRWEMDNIIRGARDVRLDDLEKAMHKMALFEENAVYNSYAEGGIKGLFESAEHEPIQFGDDGTSIMESLSKAVLMMKDAYEEMPYTLVVGEEGWKRVNTEVHGYPLIKRVRDIIGGDVVFSSVVEDAILLPYNHEDLELVVGGDFSIGYDTHDAKAVQLYVAESFTFRVLNPGIIVPFAL